MVFNFKDDKGYIISYMEWVPSDKDGNPKDNGTYLYISDLWIHDEYDFLGVRIINHFIKMLDLDERCKNVEWVYWNRDKYSGRPSKLLPRKSCARRGEFLTEESFLKGEFHGK